ncbi:putative non-specific serine/threonine protein kinase [Rosa chinensis]|uniref:Putative non-specific serine/threonine protein kinase n=1 Tax=Rosa chinensis TaxID=74649 RepID=A0A2P6PWC2_ROSCH|nr:putative non-specific serine/threonine protein kinase [Rosa chinensis]
MVREGRALDVIEDMPEKDPPEVLEKYVLVAVLCSHPQLYARPTMDQVVKMLETDLSVPSIPERPIPLVAEIDDIERYCSCDSIQLSVQEASRLTHLKVAFLVTIREMEKVQAVQQQKGGDSGKR